jgi:proteasome assembly chaperone (PAC2) family protein
MNPIENDSLRIHEPVAFERSTLVLAFSGWMDGGEVSTGTVQRLVDLLGAKPFAEPFYIYNFPGSMEIAALFRPPVQVEDGLVTKLEMPENRFFAHPPGLVLFVGKEPNLRWRTFGDCVFRLARQACVERILFIGSFAGTVPHTREPRLYVSCSDAELLAEMERYGVRRSSYEGPGSFTSYLMAQAASAGFRMASLVAEIPGYLHGINPMSIEAVTRRLAKILKLSLDLDELRVASTQWELEVTAAVEQNEELATKIRELEEQYDNELLQLEGDEAETA